MIRILDEKIYTMTRQEYHDLMQRYNSACMYMYPTPSFEQWLEQGNWHRGTTTHQLEHP